MIIPYSTDAPLYHLPIATVGIIVTNIVVFCATMLQVALGNLEVESVDWLMIQFNEINPLQWLTAAFMHEGIIHLLGNMFFLFAFGLVVEGKIGNLRFLGLYLAMCVAIGAVAQIPMFVLGVDGYAMGASAVIFALMTMAVIWAPENEIEGIFWVFVFYGRFESRIISFGMFFIVFEVLFAVLNGFSTAIAMGHLCGIAVGTFAGVYLLREGYADCEGWDIVSRNDWLKEYPWLYGDKQREYDKSVEDEVANPVATALALSGGDPSLSKTIGITATPKKRSASSTSRSPGKSVKKKKRKKNEAPPTTEEIAERCQSHPEFNRLAFLFRQGVQSGNLPAAQQGFQQLDLHSIAQGLNENTLMQYAIALANEKQWVNAIRPLALIVEMQGPQADHACLRLAQIQIKVLKRPDQAIKTLAKIKTIEGQIVDDDKQRILEKRDQLLRAAQTQ